MIRQHGVGAGVNLVLVQMRTSSTFYGWLYVTQIDSCTRLLNTPSSSLSPIQPFTHFFLFFERRLLMRRERTTARSASSFFSSSARVEPSCLNKSLVCACFKDKCACVRNTKVARVRAFQRQMLPCFKHKSCCHSR